MKRSTWEGQTLVYSYGGRKGADCTEAALSQLRLAHELRNTLVEIEMQLDAATAAMWLSHPQVAEAAEAVDNARGVLVAVLESIQKSKMTERSKKVPTDLRLAAGAARVQLRDCKTTHKAAKDAAYDALKPRLVGLRRDRDAERKATYAFYVQQRGLYWPTYNDVLAKHDTAVRSVASLRRQGRPAQMRFHRWTGEGTLSLQLQREADDPRRSPEAIGAGTSKWRKMIKLPYIDVDQWALMSRKDQRGWGRQQVSVRIGSQGAQPVWWTIPVTWHRPLPADADITNVQVTRRRVGSHYRLSVTVSLRLPTPAECGPGRPAVAVNLGWRSLGDGSYRVATWTASGPLELPYSHELAEWFAPSFSGTSGEIVIPASYASIDQGLQGRQGLRDDKLNLVRAELVSWLESNPEMAEMLELDPANVARWRSPGRLAALALRWRELPWIDPSMAARLEAWRKQDKHLWEWESNERDQLIARRRDVYRKVSKLLADQAGMVVVESSDLANMAKLPRPDQEDSTQAKRARSQRTMAAPGALRQCLVQAATKAGVPVVHADPTGITAVHTRCGTDLAARGVDFALEVRVWCPTCMESVDQDYNACHQLLARSIA